MRDASDFSVCIFFEEIVFIFQFLNDKMHNYANPRKKRLTFLPKVLYEHFWHWIPVLQVITKKTVIFFSDFQSPGHLLSSQSPFTHFFLNFHISLIFVYLYYKTKHKFSCREIPHNSSFKNTHFPRKRYRLRKLRNLLFWQNERREKPDISHLNPFLLAGSQ